jgi:hypothetical protein
MNSRRRMRVIRAAWTGWREQIKDQCRKSVVIPMGANKCTWNLRHACGQALPPKHHFFVQLSAFCEISPVLVQFVKCAFLWYVLFLRNSASIKLDWRVATSDVRQSVALAEPRFVAVSQFLWHRESTHPPVRLSFWWRAIRCQSLVQCTNNLILWWLSMSMLFRPAIVSWANPAILAPIRSRLQIGRSVIRDGAPGLPAEYIRSFPKSPQH